MSAGTTVAFIGLGLMGKPMAGHLLAAGHAVRVYNRTGAKAASLGERGATVCASPRDAARGAQIVCLCVGDAPDVREVLFGPGGAAEGAERGALVVDHSTIAPLAAQEFAARCRERGLRFLDAPVSGGQKGAIEGTLAIMCGGDERDFEAARPVLRAYGKKLTLVGPSGMGQAAKACNQILCVHNILGVAEALTLAESLGADPAKVVEAVKDGAAASWALAVLGAKVLVHDDSPGFYVRHQQKDLRIVLEAARAAGTPLPGTALIHELYKVVQARGGDECGNHVLYRALDVLRGADWRQPPQPQTHKA